MPLSSLAARSAGQQTRRGYDGPQVLVLANCTGFIKGLHFEVKQLALQKSGEEEYAGFIALGEVVQAC